MKIELEKAEEFKAPNKDDFLEILKCLNNSDNKYRTNINLEERSK